MRNLFFAIFSIVLIISAFSISNAQIATCVSEKSTTLPLSGDYGSFGPYAVTRQFILNPEPNAPAPVSIFIPSNASPQNKVPAVFFGHGFGGISYQFYENLLRQLASNGYIVVFSPYNSSIPETHAARYNQLWTGFLTAVQQNSTIIDTTRVGFAGHSYGAGATPEMARRGAQQGWGTNGLFMFVMAPWFNWGTNMEQIPSSAKMIIQLYWDDTVNQHLIAQNDIWNRLPQVTEKRWQVIRASQTNCVLEAGHNVPVSDGGNQTDAISNGYDYWGVWRRLHALSVYTFTGNQTAKNVAYGVDANMGKWRGIFASRPISPIVTTDFPVPNILSDPAFLWRDKCLYAQGSPCP